VGKVTKPAPVGARIQRVRCYSDVNGPWRSKRQEPSGATQQSASRWRLADPPPPAILLDRPPLLLDLQPPPRPRRPALVRADLVLGDVALGPALDHLRPRLQPIGREPAHRNRSLPATFRTAPCDRDATGVRVRMGGPGCYLGRSRKAVGQSPSRSAWRPVRALERWRDLAGPRPPRRCPRP
jgi:hypothetical protein